MANADPQTQSDSDPGADSDPGSDSHPGSDSTAEIRAVRRFSRFYTRRIGVLHEGLLGGPLTLTEGRIVYELAQAGEDTAARLGAGLGLDAGYLSRLLRGLAARGLVARRPSARDGRQSLLSLTAAGRALFTTIDARSQAEVGAMLAALPAAGRRHLVAALATAERLLGATGAAPAPVTLRAHRPGDMGWVVHRQAVLYAAEYGWDGSFEALVAEIVAKFIRDFDPARERCWIAEREGAVLGSVFLVRDTDEVAKLRLLYVEAAARGLGLGRRLVEECIGFARAAGYRRLTLWTNDILVAARHIYQQAGFRLVGEERHHSFGHDLVGQFWELDL
ncbi:MAG: MarR family transcriptional regulator [Rhodospirillales bacterium]|nr:MarR family transcriptional regulator [Rhodospirillales bacterium]MDE2576196.1 MarR family transcriptional regulator [Rhodospirillales bacterium]